MYKIKLLTLLSISFILFQSCSRTLDVKTKFSLDYIPGEIDGLNLNNILLSNLESSGLYDENSKLIIRANITHAQDLFITNVDNTSDRENIISTINVTILNQENSCHVFKFTDNEEQFYVIASTQNLVSNNTAVEQIKIRNVENLVHNLVFKLISLDTTACIYEQ